MAPAVPTVASTVQPTCGVPTGSITFDSQSGVAYSIGSGFQASPIFKGVAPGTYTLTVRSTSDTSCSTNAASTVTINAVPMAPAVPTVASTVQPTCGVPTGSITFDSQSGVAYSIGSGFQTSPIFTGIAPGTYTLTVRSTSGDCLINGVKNITIVNFFSCDDIVDINKNETKQISIYENDTNVPILGTLTFTNPTNGSITINDNGTPDNPSDDVIQYIPNLNFEGTDTFSYTICDDSLPAVCSTSNIIINVRSENKNGCLTAYNIFSPDGDGINDVFEISCLSKDEYKNNRLEVYDRWGNLVYQKRNYDNSWKGTFDG
ncbi:gliding motility-associated C-terminal domain-containing protein, partial [Candidatus Albibeggiatoa sp. nov. NOAA]|uniref:T9SS type B sorting domain-containing protein n=1 Tax=Candidatus Albibeggiatoa sp. nov. NOAA TaxID=3162724 RepID=UPI0032F177B7|nr:gliding motility-associated C-terminal domain-containing protein [Thiotrichaceae bacterium]